jgi:hypothetical protein
MGKERSQLLSSGTSSHLASDHQLGLESCLELIREEVHLLLNRDPIDIMNFITNLIIDPEYNCYYLIGPADYQVGRYDS